MVTDITKYGDQRPVFVWYLIVKYNMEVHENRQLMDTYSLLYCCHQVVNLMQKYL